MAINQYQWQIREIGANPSFNDLYGSIFNKKYTTFELYHGGRFTPTPGRDYILGRVTVVDFIEAHKISHELLSHIVKGLGYTGKPHFYRSVPSMRLDLGLIKVATEIDFKNFFNHVFPDNCNRVHRVYVEIDRESHVASYPRSLIKADPKIHEKLIFHYVFDHPFCSIGDACNFLLEQYEVWIPPTMLRAGFDLARLNAAHINGDI